MQRFALSHCDWQWAGGKHWQKKRMPSFNYWMRFTVTLLVDQTCFAGGIWKKLCLDDLKLCELIKTLLFLKRRQNLPVPLSGFHDCGCILIARNILGKLVSQSKSWTLQPLKTTLTLHIEHLKSLGIYIHALSWQACTKKLLFEDCKRIDAIVSDPVLAPSSTYSGTTHHTHVGESKSDADGVSWFPLLCQKSFKEQVMHNSFSVLEYGELKDKKHFAGQGL